MRFYEGHINSLKENEIFVFGSNPEGRHGRGAAKYAKDKFGAIYGKGRGLQGQSYALPTKNLTPNYEEQISKRKKIVYEKSGDKSLSKEQIKTNIKELYKLVRTMPESHFYIAYQNDYNNLNGYSSEEMFDLFTEKLKIPKNIYFSDTFKEMAKEKGFLSQYLPEEDGVTHINVYTKAKTKLGRLLTNMSNISFPIKIKGKEYIFSSLEGYWYFTKIKLIKGVEDFSFQNIDCFSAKIKGNNFLKGDNKIKEEDYPSFQKEIKKALKAKIENNEEIKELLISTTLPFIHYYYYGEGDDSKIILKKEDEWMMKEIEKIRKELQKKEPMEENELEF